MLTLASHAAHKAGLLFRARRLITSVHLFHLHKAQIPDSLTLQSCEGFSLDYRSLFLSKFKEKPSWLTNDPFAMSNMQSIAQHLAAASLSLVYRYYFDFFSSEPVSTVSTPRTFVLSSRIQTANKP